MRVEISENRTQQRMAKARILIVDDEPIVLAVAARVLERAGYETQTASGPFQALELLKIGEGCDLVLSDVVMPRMCGPELAAQIRSLSPSSAIILMSGCVLSGDLPEGVPFIGKPFSPSDLLRAVGKALDRSGPGTPVSSS